MPEIRHSAGITVICTVKASGSDAIQIVAPVIANPQGEAIHARTLDCFTLRVRNDGSACRLLKSPFFPMTIHGLHFVTI
jgi:hypothetical protein